jgi:acyl-CoA synthetase (AMP-forming)/AMP-acid ligase II
VYFWNFSSEEQKFAVITSKNSYTYKELNETIDTKRQDLSGSNKSLVLMLCKQDFDVLAMYIAALRSNHAVMLLDNDMDELLLEDIIKIYKPLWIYGSCNSKDYHMVGKLLWKRNESPNAIIHPDLAILLSTSGTTGSQKFVRLSYANIQSNAKSIVKYLKIDSSERGIANLPISYSYGLSIINSHLVAKATLLLTSESVISKSFWEFFERHEATSFGGVPYTYQMLQKIGFLKRKFSHLRYFTQAGGRLNEKLVRMFGEYALGNAQRFYVMYGQTEASPRISYIPPEKLLDKTGTIGQAIPCGILELAVETNELIYKGPNVMLGYANSLEDLSKGDEHFGILHTGDTASVDEDGFFAITGRIKRFVKLFGLRVNLDEVEKMLETQLQKTVACTGTDDRMIILVESENLEEQIQSLISSVYKLHHSAYHIKVVETIPRLLNGKINYSQMKEWLM